ncbi:MAG: hypothetical protein Q9225_004806 [Loekoesia sp. 1 TL-2023]
MWDREAFLANVMREASLLLKKSLNSLSATDIVCILKNARIVDKALAQFESQIVSRVKTLGHRAEDYYGDGVVRHPPHLTRTERPRFISSYYQLWALLKINNVAVWEARLASMTLKQLFHLYEMSKLPQSFGQGEEVVPPPRHPDAEAGTIFAINYGTSKERVVLIRLVLKHLEEAYRRTHGKDLQPIWAYAGEEGSEDFIAMWDHWQPSLKEVICGRRANEPPYRKVLDLELWEDSSGDGY